MTKRAVCTVVTKNYIAYARTLAKSVIKHNPNIEFYVLLADKLDSYFDPAKEPFKLIELEHLSDQTLIQKMCFYYTPFELCNGLRGYLHEYMFHKTSIQSWLYLDSDILVFGSLDSIFKQLEETSILLSPHSQSPVPTENIDLHELNCLRGGVFNSGFLGLTKSEETEAFITWFKHRLSYYSFNDVSQGLFVDQIWLNLVPTYFRDYSFLTHPGANVGHWNLHERQLELSPSGQVLVNGESLLFFHFSGWDINLPTLLSKYAPIYNDYSSEAWQVITKQYREDLLENGYEITKALPYAFSCFENGKSILPESRRLYYEGLKEKTIAMDDPFANYHYFNPSKLMKLTKKLRKKLRSLF